MYIWVYQYTDIKFKTKISIPVLAWCIGLISKSQTGHCDNCGLSSSWRWNIYQLQCALGGMSGQSILASNIQNVLPIHWAWENEALCLVVLKAHLKTAIESVFILPFF